MCYSETLLNLASNGGLRVHEKKSRYVQTLTFLTLYMVRYVRRQETLVYTEQERAEPHW